MRCVHEASQYENNCFITLTYAPEYTPLDASLKKVDFQKFMKRLRAHVRRVETKQYKHYQQKADEQNVILPKLLHEKIKFFACGEYGENTDLSTLDTLGHPHYHACLFNYDFPDKYIWKETNGILLYRSPTLEKLWEFGFSTIGEVTFESAAYVARYTLKKINGPSADQHYETFDLESGEITQKTREFILMSRRPGIAHGWYQEFKTDLDKDFISMRGTKLVPPKYYDRLLSQEPLGPEELEKRKQKRLLNAEKHAHDNTSKRLSVREFIKLKKLKLLPRGNPNDN